VFEGQAALGEGAAFINLQNTQLDTPTYEHLSEIAAPALIIVGEQDIEEFHAMGDELSHGITDAQHMVITGAGHLVPLEKPADVTEARLAFLNAIAATPGVTSSEIILGAHTPLTGPLANFSEISRATKAYFDYINATEGGVHGRKITYLLADDAYTPPQTEAVVKKLVEEDHIFALVGGVGTPTHMQVVDYLQEAGVPDLFVIGGSTEWVKDPAARSAVFGSNLNFAVEGTVLGLYLAETYPGKKLGLFYQNTGFADGIDGLKRGLGDALTIAGEESYEVGPPDLSAQVNRLHDAGVDVIVAFAPGPFFAAAIEHARLELNWDVSFVTPGPGASGATMVGDLAQGVVSVGGLRETNDPAIAQHEEILRTYSDLPGVSAETIYGQYVGELTVAVLKEAGRDLTRAKVTAAAESIQDFLCSLCLYPVNLSATDHSPIDAALLQRFDGSHWVYFGDGYRWEGVQPADVSAENVEIVPAPAQ
jgi:branched-chain amino acid transport system substrate-binding protein